jgi:acrosin
MVRHWLRQLARELRRPTPPRKRPRGPALEPLEDRTTPSTLDFQNGTLIYTASPGVASNFTISLSGSTYTLNDTAETINVTAAAAAAGFSASGNTATGHDGAAVQAISVTLGNLNDTANIRSFSKPLSLTTGAGNDTINVSSTGLTGNLNGIGANLTIDAGAGANTLNVSNYTATSGDSNVVIGNTQITGFAGPSGSSVISYAATGGSFSLLHVLGSNTPTLAQKFTVDNPNATTFQLNAENGTNTINVEAISGAANITGGLGADAINVCSSPDLTGSLDNINGTLTIDGGQGVNTLTVSDAGTAGPANTAVITATQITGFAGATNNQIINYKAVGGSFGSVHLIGASDSSLADQFTVNNPNGPLTLDAGAGDNVINVVALSNSATINGQGGNNTFNVSSDAPAHLGTLNNINGTLTLNGGSGTNSLYVSDYGQTAKTANVTITPSSITGFAGSAKTTAINYAAGTFASVTLSGSNTLSDNFNVSGQTPAVLMANGGGDTFKLADGASALSIDGGSGTDTLDLSASTSAVNVTLAAPSNAAGYQGSATGLANGFTGIDVLTAGTGQNTLTGENVASTWTLGSTAQTYNDGGSTSLTFSGFQTLDGGSAADTFAINAATGPVTQINGGAGNDVFNVNAPATVNLSGGDGNDTFNLNSGGVLNGTITGGSGSDTLNYAGAVAVTVTGSGADGYAGNDGGAVTGGWSGIDAVFAGAGSSLTGDNTASTWTLGGGSQNYNDGSGPLAFSGFATVNAGSGGDIFDVNGATDVTTANGGAGDDTFNVNASAALNLNGGAGNDTFNMAGGAVLSGIIDGGTGSDTLSYAAYTTPVAVTLTGTGSTGLKSISAPGVTAFKGIDVLVGGQGTTDSLTGQNVASTWNLGGTNTYSNGTATLTFSAFETVNAGTAGDTFNIGGATDVTAANGGTGNDAFNVSGSAPGLSIAGNGGSDALSYAGYKSGAVSVALTGSDSTGLSSTSATGLAAFKGISGLVGGPGSGDSLTGENVASTWALGGTNTYSDGTATLTFSAFETVNAGTAGDTFNIGGGSDVTAANGGAGDDAFNVNASATMNLSGGAGKDAFNLGDGVALTGTITGGTGTDTLSYAAYTGDVTVVVAGSDATGYSSGAGTTGVTGFQGIDVIVGGQGNNTLTGENTTSTWTLGAKQTYDDGAGNGTLTFSGFEVLNAGTRDNTFNVTQTTAGVPLTLNGNGGDNVFNVSSLDTVQGDFTINGGSGNNSLNVDDTANTTSVGWLIDATDVQRFGSGNITYSGIASVTVTTGTPTDGFSNALNVESVAAGTSVTVQASQTDVVVAQVSQNLSGIQGGLVIDAVGSHATVTVDDSQNTADTNYTINGVTGTVSTGSASIQVLEVPTSLVVLGGSGTNNFDVTPSTSYPITVDGGSGGNNTLTYQTGGSTTWTDTGLWISDADRGVQDVTYNDFGVVIHA